MAKNEVSQNVAGNSSVGWSVIIVPLVAAIVVYHAAWIYLTGYNPIHDVSQIITQFHENKVKPFIVAENPLFGGGRGRQPSSVFPSVPMNAAAADGHTQGVREFVRNVASGLTLAELRHLTEKKEIEAHQRYNQAYLQLFEDVEYRTRSDKEKDEELKRIASLEKIGYQWSHTLQANFDGKPVNLTLKMLFDYGDGRVTDVVGLADLAFPTVLVKKGGWKSFRMKESGEWYSVIEFQYCQEMDSAIAAIAFRQPTSTLDEPEVRILSSDLKTWSTFRGGRWVAEKRLSHDGTPERDNYPESSDQCRETVLVDVSSEKQSL